MMDIVERGDREAGAIYNATETHRYVLWRRWDERSTMVAFIGLNPSTATELVLDPTVTRCRNYAERWGYGGMYMLNAYALRSTDPRGLKKVDDPVGALNNEYIRIHTLASSGTALVVACWGSNCPTKRQEEVLQQIVAPEIYALAMAQSGKPKHPLYLRGDLRPFVWKSRAIRCA